MRCQFCGDVLNLNQSVTCSPETCRKAAKRVRQRRRQGRSMVPVRQEAEDEVSWEFPPELEYLNQDPGISVGQMLEARLLPALRRSIVARREARSARLRDRQAGVL